VEHRRTFYPESPTTQHNYTNITTLPDQADHSINDVRLIPIAFTRSERDSVRKAGEAHLIADKAKTLHPLNRGDEERPVTQLTLIYS